MAKINVYNQEGKIVSTALLPKEIFNISINQDLIHQIVVSQMSNRRKVIAHTKTRAEVRGGVENPGAKKERVGQGMVQFVLPCGEAEE